MKKLALFLVMLLTTAAAHAQFEQGKSYYGASLYGFDIGSQAEKFHFKLGTKAGTFMADNLLATIQLGYEHLEGTPDSYTIGVGGRYYITQNGIYLGASAKYQHANHYNDILPGVQIGYAFFISRTVTLEPELYIDFSTKRFANSNYGLGVGMGIYLFKDQTKN